MALLRQKHEEFISGHNGTSIIEATMSALTPCYTLFLRNLLLVMFKLHRLSFWPKIFFDFSTIVVPVIVLCTIFTHITIGCCILLSITAALYFGTLVNIFRTEKCFRLKVHTIRNIKMDEHRPFLTHFKSITSMMTAIVILAVDFRVFPRRLAKTESFGVSAMDIGVVFFVISNALVSPDARDSRQCSLSVSRSSLEALRRLSMAVKSSLPLVVLGLVRLCTVKGFNYHEHNSEYGVHWNFFFTLVVVKVACTALLCMCPARLATFLALMLASTYQVALSSFGLANYILLGSDGEGGRHDLLDSNREGIFSCFGYAAIYLVGVHLGNTLFHQKKQIFEDWVKTLPMLLLLAVLSYAGYHISVMAAQQEASRRMANLPFVLLSVGFVCVELLVLLAIDLLSLVFTVTVLGGYEEGDLIISERHVRRRWPSGGNMCLLQSINYNGLFYFLLANVMTGAVNISVDTLQASSLSSVAILLIYMLCLSAVIVSMRMMSMRTKFW